MVALEFRLELKLGNDEEPVENLVMGILPNPAPAPSLSSPIGLADNGSSR